MSTFSHPALRDVRGWQCYIRHLHRLLTAFALRSDLHFMALICTFLLKSLDDDRFSALPQLNSSNQCPA
jgi:hypothetical protein